MRTGTDRVRKRQLPDEAGGFHRGTAHPRLLGTPRLVPALDQGRVGAIIRVSDDSHKGLLLGWLS